jgi:hypothetical protein
MSSFAIPRNISFRVETLYVRRNNRVGTIRPDDNGIYSGLPMMVLGEETQQRTYYDPTSIMNQITNPESRFAKIFSQQKAYGEYGHPSFLGLSDGEKLQRLTMIDERNISHLFTSFYTDDNARPGTPVVLRANVKPTGPMGQVFKDSLDDPILNTAFSLRAYVDTQVKPNGLKYRTVRSLTTFDTVGPSGYATTDKANAIGLESFASDNHLECSVNITENGNLVIDQVALESFHNSDLNELFGTCDVARIIQSTTIVKPDPSMMDRFPGLYTRGILNDFFKEI